MIDVKDRIPTQPNRKKITYDDGRTEYAKVEYADNPTEPGTPINKVLFDSIRADLSNALTLSDNQSLLLISVICNGSPAPGAEITINNNRFKTDEQGKVNILGNIDTTYTISLSSAVVGGTCNPVTYHAVGGERKEIELIIKKDASLTQKEFKTSQEILLYPGIVSFDLFLVGGGGGGGVSGVSTDGQMSSYGGGGGGGYTATYANLTPPGLTPIYVTVGAGGTGMKYEHSHHKSTYGTAGGSSTVTIGETVYQANGGSDSRGSSGGAGGSNGGNGSGNGGSDGVPGQGTTTRAFGESSGTLYAGGGGGSNGYGGEGGGGNGSAKNYSNQHQGYSGEVNTGGGGGGAYYNYSASGEGTSGYGGNGGSGIVIFRWRW